MSGAFVVATFVTAVNAARLHGALPDGGRRQRLAVTAMGATITWGAYLALAALAGPLLEGLAIDDASAAVAAGLVLLAAAGRDLLVRPPAAEPALAGWRAALVPVAVPLLFRPELAVFTIAASAAAGAVTTGAAAALALASVVAVAALPGPSSAPARVRSVLARLAAAALVLLAVELTIDGILAV